MGTGWGLTPSTRRSRQLRLLTVLVLGSLLLTGQANGVQAEAAAPAPIAVNGIELVTLRGEREALTNGSKCRDGDATYLGVDYEPAWAPNARDISFARFTSAHCWPNLEIYVMDSSSRELTRVTFNDVPDGSPTWDPSGTRIAMSRWQEGTGYDICTLDLLSDQDVCIEADGDELDPTWAPNSDVIAFTNCNEAGCTIAKVSPTGDSLGWITESGYSRWPDWSPDGSAVAVSTKGRRGRYRLRILTPDGAQVAVSRAKGSLEQPSWSPDGSRVVVSECVRKTCTLKVVRIADQHERELGSGYAADWRPKEVRN